MISKYNGRKNLPPAKAVEPGNREELLKKAMESGLEEVRTTEPWQREPFTGKFGWSETHQCVLWQHSQDSIEDNVVIYYGEVVEMTHTVPNW